MKNLNEEEIFERLHCRWEDRKITHEEITNPDYEIWGRAREWEYHQAVCLLSGLVPLSKPYFDILFANRSAFDLVYWISYYPIDPKDQTRLINIGRLLKPLIVEPKQGMLTIHPKSLIAQCKNHTAIGPTIPQKLIEVVEQFGPHPSLNLPNAFTSLELNPSVFQNLKKSKEREKAAALMPKNEAIPRSLPIPPKPQEAPLAIGKRLFPLKSVARWEKADSFSMNEIILLHYFIDPDMVYRQTLPGEVVEDPLKEFSDYLNRYFHGDRQLFVSALDEEKVIDLLRRSILAGNLKFSDQGIISRAEIVGWMNSKKLSFPIRNLPLTEEDSERNLKEEILTFDLKRYDKDQISRLIVRAAAASIWKDSPSLKLPDIKKHPRFKSARKLAGEIGGKPEGYDDKTIDDWIRDISPNYSPKK